MWLASQPQRHEKHRYISGSKAYCSGSERMLLSEPQAENRWRMHSTKGQSWKLIAGTGSTDLVSGQTKMSTPRTDRLPQGSRWRANWCILHSIQNVEHQPPRVVSCIGCSHYLLDLGLPTFPLPHPGDSNTPAEESNRDTHVEGDWCRVIGILSSGLIEDSDHSDYDSDVDELSKKIATSEVVS